MRSVIQDFTKYKGISRLIFREVFYPGSPCLSPNRVLVLVKESKRLTQWNLSVRPVFRLVPGDPMG